MKNDSLYSLKLALCSDDDVTISSTNGRQAQALFLNLVGQFDSALSARLHDEPGYRPYTVARVIGGTRVGERFALGRGEHCHLRITLLDGGVLWQKLCQYFLESGPVHVKLGESALQLVNILSSPVSDPQGWVNSVDWRTLFTLPARRSITMHFASPTAFSWGNRRYVLFPQPFLLWENLLHAWNRNAPECYRIEKQGLRKSLMNDVRVTRCSLVTRVLHFPNFSQKGFVGVCTYAIQGSNDFAKLLTTLAAFSYYAGAGSKTTMGMGQVRVTFDDRASEVPVLHDA